MYIDDDWEELDCLHLKGNIYITLYKEGDKRYTVCFENNTDSTPLAVFKTEYCARNYFNFNVKSAASYGGR